jgi:eukaryotic-like serine/threonine-protein kinase
VHDKLREVAYAELSADERRDFHRRLAVALEAHLDRDRLEGQLGHHWSGADEPARAIPYLHRAGDRAHALYALRDAADLYRATLHDLGRVPAGDSADAAARTLEEAMVREKLAATLALTGAHEAARDEYERAIALFGPGRQVEVARVHRKIGKSLETLHDHPRVLEAYASAEALLDSTQERDANWQAEWIQVHLNRIWVHYWQARIADMDAQLARVAPLVEAHGLPLQRSSYYQAIVTRNYRQHRYAVSDETLEYARQSLAFAIEAGARVEAGMARFVLGFGLLFHGDLAPAEAELYEALQETRRLGDVTSQIRCLAYLVITCRRAGAIGDARRFADEMLPLASAVKMHDYVGVAQAGLGWAAWRTGDDDEARQHCQAALDSWAQPSYAYPFQWTGALTMLALQASRAPLRQLVGLAEKMLDVNQMQLPEAIDRALHTAVAAYGVGDADAARDALQQAITEAKRLGFI